MIRVFLDSGEILDFLLKREPFAEHIDAACTSDLNDIEDYTCSTPWPAPPVSTILSLETWMTTLQPEVAGRRRGCAGDEQTSGSMANLGTHHGTVVESPVSEPT